jgi:predicted ATPase
MRKRDPDGGGLLRPPFLRKLVLQPERFAGIGYPFDLPILCKGRLSLEFERPITLFVGENGTGKSTLLEAIAAQIGFNIGGGSRDHAYGGTPAEPGLAGAMRLSWLPKVTNGFFLRGESYFNFATYIDEIRRDPRWTQAIAASYGERELHGQSHGQSLLALFGKRFGTFGRVIYLLDEPETALSPSRQLAFLKLLRRWERSGRAQFIIASHAPIILSYPGADLLCFDGGRIRRTSLQETEHWRVTRDFLADPETALAALLDGEADAEEAVTSPGGPA